MSEQKFQVGDVVEVLDGQYQGTCGPIESINDSWLWIRPTGIGRLLVPGELLVITPHAVKLVGGPRFEAQQREIAPYVSSNPGELGGMDKPDTRLPIDPAKLTVGEEFEFTCRGHVVWTFAHRTSKNDHPGSSGIYELRAAQPPIDSLRPGDVVEASANTNPAERGVVVARRDSSTYIKFPSANWGMIALENSFVRWRLVYRAENVPQQGVSVSSAMMLKDGGDENNLQDFVPRPFSWSDLKPGDEFEVDLPQGWVRRKVDIGGQIVDLAGELCMPHSNAYAVTAMVGRWPVNKSQESSASAVKLPPTQQPRLNPHAGSAGSSKPAKTPKDILAARPDVQEKLRKVAEKLQQPSERIIPWDGQDMSQLKKGRYLVDRHSGERFQIMVAPTPSHASVTFDRHFSVFPRAKVCVETARSLLNGYNLVEKIQPPPRWAKYLNHGGDDE